MKKLRQLQEFLFRERERLGNPTLDEIADHAHLSIGAIHAYFQGSTFPTNPSVHKLAVAFRKSKRDRDAFIAQLNEIRERETEDPLTRTAQRKTDLRISFMPYPPFCTGHAMDAENAGFLDEAVFRLFALTKLGYEATTRAKNVDVIEELMKGEVDLAVSLFETYDRIENIRTLASPLRTTLNAVVIPPAAAAGGDWLESTRRDLDRLLDPGRNLGTGERGAEAGRFHFRFVGLPSEAGYCFLRDVLKLDIAAISPTESLEPTAWAKQVTDLEKQREVPHTIVALADEYSMLRLLAHIGDSHSTARLLWPLATLKTVLRRRTAPLFPIGLLSAARHHEQLIDRIDACLRLMLRTDRELLAGFLERQYKRLAKNIEEWIGKLSPDARLDLYREQREPIAAVEEARADKASEDERWRKAMSHRVARFATSLEGVDLTDDASFGGLAWGPIVRRAIEKIGPRIEVATDSWRAPSALVRTDTPFSAALPKEDRSELDATKLLKMTLGPLDIKNAAGARNALDTEEEVIVGFLETPRRIENWTFLRSPFWLPLNIVSGQGEGEAPFEFGPGQNVTVQQNGAAKEYLANKLNGAAIHPVDTLSAAGFAEAFCRYRNPVVMVDTLTCLDVLMEIERIRPDSSVVARLVNPEWPDAEEPASGHWESVLPSFQFAAAVRKGAGIHHADLQQRSRQQLESNTALMASELHDLVGRMADEIRKKMEHLKYFQNPSKTAWQWACRIASVDEYSAKYRCFEGDPWRGVCAMARERLAAEAADRGARSGLRRKRA